MNNVANKAIKLFGTKVLIFEDKVQIMNDANIPMDEFKPQADKIAQYLVDEMFIEKKNKIRIEVVSLKL